MVEESVARERLEPGSGAVTRRQPATAEAAADESPAAREIGELRAALAAAQERERVLAHELQHRIRNMLGVIRSIYRRTRESGASQDEFAEHFEGRLDALARYQAQVDHVGAIGIEVEDMVRNELLESQCLDGPKCTISGPPVHLRQKPAELMGLAIHELATNAIKFGALAQHGRLDIEWSLEEAAAADLLRFRWTESGVSVVVPAPRPSGFGRQLIEEALPYQLGATTSFDLKPGGVECSILLPLRGLTAKPDDQADEEPPALPSAVE
ncbi:MAG: sensor histidine kinase [Sphingomonadaceae bacterium]|nr:sensor histidine kinase [Sphingomonadaceae bacterium]